MTVTATFTRNQYSEDLTGDHAALVKVELTVVRAAKIDGEARQRHSFPQDDWYLVPVEQDVLCTVAV